MSMVEPLNRERLLMGPGRGTVPQRILRIMGAPTLGHLDPQYIAYMDETCQMLRDVYQTDNALTFPVSGTGMAGMETIIVNLVEPGDEVIVCINGVFGGRMKDNMERAGAIVHALEIPWGQTFTSRTGICCSILQQNCSALSMPRHRPGPAGSHRNQFNRS